MKSSNNMFGIGIIVSILLYIPFFAFHEGKAVWNAETSRGLVELLPILILPSFLVVAGILKVVGLEILPLVLVWLQPILLFGILLKPTNFDDGITIGMKFNVKETHHEDNEILTTVVSEYSFTTLETCYKNLELYRQNNFIPSCRTSTLKSVRGYCDITKDKKYQVFFELNCGSEQVPSNLPVDPFSSQKQESLESENIIRKDGFCLIENVQYAFGYTNAIDGGAKSVYESNEILCKKELENFKHFKINGAEKPVEYLCNEKCSGSTFVSTSNERCQSKGSGDEFIILYQVKCKERS